MTLNCNKVVLPKHAAGVKQITGKASRGFWIFFLLSSCFALLARMSAEAWIGEDAFITFRTIDNFINGWGLRSNLDERVQVYTHPLWMLINSFFYYFTREIPYTVASVGLASSIAAYIIVLSNIRGRPIILAVLVFALLVSSRTFALYATSGFETSLGFLLIALFTTELLRENHSGDRRWGLLSLYASLAILNRFDYIFLVAPALAFVSIFNWRTVVWSRTLLGLAPLASWIVFSLVYYGFAYPNTAPAKLSADIPAADYIWEGITYAADLVRWDYTATPIIMLAMLTTLGAAFRFRCDRTDQRSGYIVALGLGIIFYSLYVMRIGGGFLSGRFWAPVIFMCVVVISHGFESIELLIRRTRTSILAVIAAVLFILPVFGDTIADYFEQRLEHRKRRGPVLDRSNAHLYIESDLSWSMTGTAREWHEAGLKVKRLARDSAAPYVHIRGVIGFFGFAAGPEVTIIDVYGLTDPLMARLPLQKGKPWRVGHLLREVPSGYVHARQTGSTEQMDPKTKEYYDRLKLVVAGPLFSVDRWHTILNFHLGRYDHLLDSKETE